MQKELSPDYTSICTTYYIQHEHILIDMNRYDTQQHLGKVNQKIMFNIHSDSINQNFSTKHHSLSTLIGTHQISLSTCIKSSLSPRPALRILVVHSLPLWPEPRHSSHQPEATSSPMHGLPWCFGVSYPSQKKGHCKVKMRFSPEEIFQLGCSIGS